MKKISIAIQVLPTTEKKHPYKVIDKVIELIASKGYNYLVCPFETVVECTFDEAMDLLKEIHQECYRYDVSSVLISCKIHSKRYEDVLIEDKLAKYR